jgi:hypothetical protein
MSGNLRVVFPADFLLIHILLLDDIGCQALQLQTCSEGIRKNRSLILVIIRANI